MYTRIIKGVVFMCENFDCCAPRSGWSVGFGIPQLTEGGRFSNALHEDGHPTVTKRIPGNGAAVRLDHLPIAGGHKAGLRRENFPTGRILPGFESGWAA